MQVLNHDPDRDRTGAA